MGVVGLEVWHPVHDEQTTDRYLQMATRHGLVPTGGSDFHRETPGGILPGDLGVSEACLETLRTRVV